MRQVARLLLLIPIALLVAIGAGGFFLMIATVASPALAQLVFGAMDALADAVFGMALDGDDPAALAMAAGALWLKLIVAILIAPVVLTAIASELFGWRGAITQMTLSGMLAAAFPAALIGLNRMPTGSEAQVLAAFFLTGVVAAAVYWAIAGKGAGWAGRDGKPAGSGDGAQSPMATPSRRESAPPR
jgi:hypothetical protein